MSHYPNIDILGHMQQARKNMKRKGLERYACVLVLLAVSIFSFTPARADQNQTQVGTVVFHLTGQATSMNATVGSLGSATLDLAGGIQGDGVGGLIMENLTGSLSLGSANYSIFNGNGKSNRLGEFAIFGQSSSGELDLHGTIQHNTTVTTDSPPSRLSSLAYLALSGSMAMNLTSMPVVNVELSQNVTSTVENMTSTNANVNSTSLTQQIGSSSSNANSTSQTNSTGNATLKVSNTTSLSQIVPFTLPEQNNTTITTITQFNNQTITVYVSSTVANSTLTQITTTTAAQTTITQFSSVTVSNTMVTNSTNSAP